MTLFKEPLVHFLIAAALLFGMDSLFTSGQKDRLVVDRQTADYLVEQREDLLLRELSPVEKEGVVSSFIEEEIMYREAYKRGLDKGDSRMRRNMILKMRGLMVGNLKEPTEDDLRTFFKNNRAMFASSATYSFDQIYFRELTDAQDGVLERLRAGATHESIGDRRLEFTPIMSKVSAGALSALFGPDAAREIIGIEDDQWHGPIASPHGSHYIRITGRTPETLPSFDEMQPFLEGQWSIDQSRKIIEDEVSRLKEGYDIIVEPFSESDG